MTNKIKKLISGIPDAVHFDKADQLLKEGEALPSPLKKRKDFATLSSYFAYLIDCEHDLYIALRHSPGIIKKQDENGMTILHHAATIGKIRGTNSASSILSLLFNAPGIDFKIKDKNKDTALHLAALACEDRVTAKFVFPNYVEQAAKSGFDFSTLGNNGQAILHIVTKTSYTSRRFGRFNNVLNFLENAPKIDLNVLSSSGTTAFYYAINWLYLDEAETLLNAGANPTLFGSPDRDPLKMLDSHINSLETTLSENELSQDNEDIANTIEKLKALKHYIYIRRNVMQGVTTFGKWEEQRQELVSDLMTNPEIASKKSKEEIDQALFNQVHSAMLKEAYTFVRQNKDKLTMRELTMESYKLSLTVVLDSLATALSIPKDILRPHVEMFSNKCHQSIEAIIDDMVKIGDISIAAKAEAVTQLYGQNFKTLYPDLASGIQLQDSEVVEMGREAISKKIQPAEFGKNEAIIREQLIYINQVSPKINPTDEFKELFKSKTGITMEEYKANVAKNKTSFFGKPVDPVGNTNNNTLSKTNLYFAN